eukprot:CAMPEP_0115703900 /NCGR_PEP_ID=MMETSP0272-20121206/69359_1 /TAXON_ID=71861 /ORGANISM="Scrippsiella trochoidea, Strain CCMP3099" /LENGTH=64 /DNA_ID=CAMNT_0003144823 /DNA_START=97 /DNA_END=287 /DNA_ORIENTATION=+
MPLLEIAAVGLFLTGAKLNAEDGKKIACPADLEDCKPCSGGNEQVAAPTAASLSSTAPVTGDDT